MPRKLRIEYEGAVYHVMSRGNDGNPVFLNDHDRYSFLAGLGQVCERTGWRVHSYVLMPNHYHLQLETPEPNLVVGMKWLQGTYTQRFNLRNDKYGHLFQGRYKAIPVSTDEHYFSALSTYIHLNPVRAKFPEVLEGKLSSYPWSSFGYYIKSKRPTWLETQKVLSAAGCSDTPFGRRAYRAYIEERTADILGSDTPEECNQEWAAIRRGWYFGDESFLAFLQTHLENIPGRRESYSGESARKHDEQEALHLLDKALAYLNLTLDQLRDKKYTDPTKCLIAWLINRKTAVSNRWICETLNMGRSDCFSRYKQKIETSNDKNIINMRKFFDKY